MKWFVSFTDAEGDGEEHLAGGFDTEVEADSFIAECEEHNATGIEKFQEADDYYRSSQRLHVATVTRPDGVYRVFSDGTEELEA